MSSGYEQGQEQPVQHRVPKQLQAFSRSKLKGESAFPAPFLTVLFIASWSLDPALFGGASSLVPPIRWAIVAFMLPLGPLAAYRGILPSYTIVYFVLAIAITPLLNGALGASFPIVARIAAAASLASYAGSLDLAGRLKVVKAAMVTSAAIVLLSVLYGIVAPSNAFRSIGLERVRLYGLTQHPAVIGYLAAIVATSYLATSLIPRIPLRQRVIHLMIALIAIATMKLSDSRTSQLALLAALACLAGLKFVIKLRLMANSIRTVAVIFGLGIGIATLIPIAIAADIITITSTSDAYEGSTLGRIEIWQVGLRDFQDNFLSGNGVGTAFLSVETSDGESELFYYHSVVINYLAKTGVIGGFIVILMLVRAPVSFLTFTREIYRLGVANRSTLPLLWFSVAACSVTVVFATTEAALQNLYPSFLVFFLSITLPPHIVRVRK